MAEARLLGAAGGRAATLMETSHSDPALLRERRAELPAFPKFFPTTSLPSTHHVEARFLQ